MTQHVSDDTIIQLTLGLLEPSTAENVRRHLRECSACSALLEDVERTLDTIKEVTPRVDADIPDLASFGRIRSRWLHLAAMLAVGFGLGYLASGSFRSPSPHVVRQQIIPRPADLSGQGFVVCDEIDLGWSER